jgi:hypothetical protein
MNIRRLPIAFLVLGLVFKTFLVFLWRHGRSPGLLNLLTYYDPGARYFAERMTRLFFDYRGITFAPGSNTFFEICLVIGFGIECLFSRLFACVVISALPKPAQRFPYSDYAIVRRGVLLPLGAPISGQSGFGCCQLRPLRRAREEPCLRHGEGV